MERVASYRKGVIQRLRNPKYAYEFLSSLMEGPAGLSLEEALRLLIQIVGSKQLSKLTRLPAANLEAFANRKKTLKPEAFDLLLKPFKLRTRVILERAS